LLLLWLFVRMLVSPCAIMFFTFVRKLVPPSRGEFGIESRLGRGDKRLAL